MVRLNITMPEEIVKQLSHIRNKSHFIAEALREKFNQEKKKKRDELLMEGYQKSANEDKKITTDWESTLNDGWK